MNPLQFFIEELESNKLWEAEISLKRNEYLKVAGSTDSNLYFIVEGSMRIFVIDAKEEHTIRLGYQGNLITALDTFLNDQPSEFYIQALRATHLKSVSKEKFMQLTEHSEMHKIQWISLLRAFVLQQMERERDLLTSSPKERFEKVLKRSPHVFQEVPNKYIASYLRMSPETLSRLMNS